MKAASGESRLMVEGEEDGNSDGCLAPGDRVGVVLLRRAARSAELDSISSVKSSISVRSEIEPIVLLPGSIWVW